jgi:lipopolysaccharide/colanic/teichoic acid biosynthesis glycosyltransferase
MQGKQEIVKRSFDIAASFLGLLFLSPVIALVALTIKIDDGGPVLFSQVRMGKGFAPFTLYKFRTMVVEAEKKGSAITAGGDERITGIGRILRKYKLDELPQLVNVLKGEMSIVGPRPEDPHYVEIFHDDYRAILIVRPGITDYATLEFRNEETILAEYDDPEEAYVEVILPQKLQLSKRYISEQSFFRDILIILNTLLSIVTRD